MKLNDIIKISNKFELIRDGEFNCLGLISNKINRKVLSFIEEEKYIEHISENITCIICKSSLIKYIPRNIGIICSDSPKIGFFKLHNYLNCNDNKYARKKFKTSVGLNCTLSDRSSISSENVSIGNNVIIEDNVVIKSNVTIGDNSVIRAGTIIGGEGFEFKRVGYEEILPVAHTGGVIIGNDVEIQQNSCVNKAVFPWDDTIIGEFTKIDNFVHISHCVKIGKRCMIAAGSILGGSVVVGNDSWIGLGSKIINGITLGNECKIGIGCIVIYDVKEKDSIITKPSFSIGKFD